MRHLFTELGQSLRRNVSMHVAVVLTLFVSLTLVGLGVIAQREADKTIEYLGSELQITVWLCKADDDRPACLGEVTPAQQNIIEKTIEDNPEVDSYEYEDQQVAFDKAKELIGPEKFEGENAPVTVEDLRASYRITLKDPGRVRGDHQRGRGTRRGELSQRPPRRARADLPRHRLHQVGLPGVRAAAGAGRAAARGQHGPAGGAGSPQGDRHHAAGGRLVALHLAAVRLRGARSWLPSAS